MRVVLVWANALVPAKGAHMLPDARPGGNLGPTARWLLGSADDPETLYAKTTDDVWIAYQILGDAPVDLIVVNAWVSHLEVDWEQPRIAQMLRTFGNDARVIVFDKRGTGLSDRISRVPDLEARMDDIRAVMDAAGSTRATLLGLGDGAALAALFAATYPERSAD